MKCLVKLVVVVVLGPIVLYLAGMLLVMLGLMLRDVAAWLNIVFGIV